MKRKGFTLVELLIVIAIIGVLASMMTLSTTGGTSSAKATSIISGLRTLKSAMAMFTGDYIYSSDITNKTKSAIALFNLRSADYIDTASLTNMRKNYFITNSGDAGGAIYAGYKFDDADGKVKPRIANIAPELSLIGGKKPTTTVIALTGKNTTFSDTNTDHTAVFMEIRSATN